MFNVMLILHERPDMAREQALEYWSTTHAQIAAKIPGLRRYVQSHGVGAPAGPIPFLGVAELVFDDAAAFGAAAATSEFAAAVSDVPNFADAERLPTAFVTDVVVVG